MAFAVAVKANPEVIDQCRRITSEVCEQIKSMLSEGDWRDELIRTLQEEVSLLDFGEVAGGLGASINDGKMIVRCIGADYSIAKDGSITPDRGNKWINILLLHYVRSKGTGDCTGKWISFSELKGGFVKASSFKRECEDPLKEIFDNSVAPAAAALDRLGAVPVTGYPADYSCSLDLLPKVRALILYRKGDEEFPSSLNVLFDGITGRFLDVESITFLCEGLVHTITGLMKRPLT